MPLLEQPKGHKIKDFVIICNISKPKQDKNAQKYAIPSKSSIILPGMCVTYYTTLCCPHVHSSYNKTLGVGTYTEVL